MPLTNEQVSARIESADRDLKSRIRQLKQVVRQLIDERNQFLALNLDDSLPAAADDPVHSGDLPSTRAELMDINALIQDLSALLLNDGQASLTNAQRKTILDRYA